MTLPTIVHETFIHPFNFHHKGRIYSAAFFRNTIYAQLRKFHVDERSRAYDFSWSMSEKGYLALITATPTHYKVWIDVRVLQAECVDLEAV
ncbi:MAG: hypothetical protein AAFY26_04375 [Cyanobacteria bacterium J06638_22]